MQKILIVEDDRTIRQELKTLLERYGYSVLVTDDFRDVVGLALAENPHLILLDINLPLYDGFHICRELRRESNVPIIVVTSRSSEADELMSMNLGADNFVTKPYNTDILLAKISALLNRAYDAGGGTDAGTAQSLRFGDLTLDAGRSEAGFCGQSVELTKNELRILLLLIERQGNIVSREDMMEALWQTDSFVDDNTLTVNINRLRKKLGEIGAADILKTKRGQGYSL
ncbi:MAG: response regulator transcription factor [Clostridiales Family XIII bacterium]|jgi:DNA-binding response OmpR family regulator|nr:response regulator transcription factor [Clostridiales Family XIII bacterium]